MIGSATKRLTTVQLSGVLKVDMNASLWKIQNHSNVMRKISPAMIDLPWINSYKKVEMNKKYKEFIPIHLQDNVLYQPPTESDKKNVEEEKGEHGNLRKLKKLKILKKAELLKIEKNVWGVEKKKVDVEKK